MSIVILTIIIVTLISTSIPITSPAIVLIPRLTFIVISQPAAFAISVVDIVNTSRNSRSRAMNIGVTTSNIYNNNLSRGRSTLSIPINNLNIHFSLKITH